MKKLTFKNKLQQYFTGFTKTYFLSIVLCLATLPTAAQAQ